MRLLTLLLLSLVVVPLASPDTAVPAGQPLLWRDPGDVSKLDLVAGGIAPWGLPQAPFQFMEEDSSGTSPKVMVKDARGVQWSVKFGDEAKPAAFSSRFVAALGYFVAPCYFLREGVITGATGLQRAASYIKGDGRFENARFEIRTPDIEYLKDSAWRWDKNPFLGTKELSGLKILVALLANWDNKDARNKFFKPNTAKFLTKVDGQPTLFYSVDDWGRTMGSWGGFGSHSTWSCNGYIKQTPDLIDSVKNGMVKLNFSGAHNEVSRDIPVEHVQWFMQYLGRISDRQITQLLDASGAKPEEWECFSNHVQARIESLRKIASPARAQ